MWGQVTRRYSVVSQNPNVASDPDPRTQSASGGIHRFDECDVEDFSSMRMNKADLFNRFFDQNRWPKGKLR